MTVAPATDAERAAIRRTDLITQKDRYLGRTPAPLGATLEVAGRDGARTEPITQDELRRYHQLKAEQRRLEEELEARRKSLIDRLAERVPVEPGPYRAKFSVSMQQKLTAGKLQEILTEAELEDLRCRVAPTPHIALWVTLGE
jgi:hypothetical protein